MSSRHLALVLALTAGGCSVDGDYPSLAPRPIEKLSLDRERPPTPPPPDTSVLPPQLQAAVAAAEASDRPFREELARASAAAEAARGAAPGSERWADAQHALSRAQGARVSTTAAMDALEAERTAREAPPSPALLDAIDRVAALNAAQSEALRAVENALAPF